MQGAEFYQNIKDKSKFENEVFNFKIELDKHNFHGNFLNFYNCTFNELSLKGVNLNSVKFSRCTFNFEVKIKECIFSFLRLTGIKKMKSLFISEVEVNELELKSENELEADFYFNYITVTHSLDFSGLRIAKGEFKCVLETQQQNNYHPEAKFNNSIFNDFTLEGHFNKISFEKVKIINSAMFVNCEIDKTSYFNNTDFGLSTRFNTCIFNSTVSFKDCKNLKDTVFSIEICTFKNNAFFTQASFKSFEITDSTFEARISFDSLKVVSIKFHLITFMKNAFFDELKIFQIKDCNRSTLRTIKQELQKADNKIDYNRFRSYELSAYYRELKWYDDFKDKFILGATILSTGYDHSWRRALSFTIISGFTWYSILYRIENTGSFNPNHIEDFFNGSYRFFLVTDFYSPFEYEKRVYLQNGWSGLVMILGKIFIAFGIYEMIQAFRKFKA